MKKTLISRSLSIIAITVGIGLANTASAVWINEIHYDNSGGDMGEFVEVAGVSGTDLAGWSIALYNGSVGAVYATINLSGVIGDEANGFGAMAFARAPIQNGSPDGLALVNAANSVVQFLSYEGAFTAIEGPAIGLTSVDLGVSEAGTESAGNSLQLTGIGGDYIDFTWSGPVAESPSSLNAGQTFVAGSVPDAGASSGCFGISLASLCFLNYIENRRKNRGSD